MTSFFKNIPPRLATSESSDPDRDRAASQPFTALDYALSVDQDFHPITWRAVKGTVFEQPYRRAFPHHDFEKFGDS
jgi:hypothetical protein